MSYTDFKNDFLDEVGVRLSAVDVGAATESELLVKGALFKMASSVAQAETVNATLSRMVGMSSVALTTWLADIDNREAFEHVISSPESMNAIASTAVLTAITSSAVAMNAIVNNKTALENIYLNPLLLTAFKGGSGLTSTVNPTMTSPTAPSGVASASSQQTNYEAWRGMSGNRWWTVSGQNTDQYLQYKFDAAVFIHTLELVYTESSTIQLLYSDDGNLWFPALEAEYINSYTGTPYQFPILVAGRHKYWRLLVRKHANPAATYIQASMKLRGFS